LRFLKIYELIRLEIHGLLDERQDVSRRYPELEDGVEAEEEREEDTGLVAFRIGLFQGRTHIHDDDDPEVVIDGNQTGQNGDDDQATRTALLM
jgi:hypothetical protein